MNLYIKEKFVGRAGGFSANFSPEVLEGFRTLCKEQGKQYTKVLEQMAEIYIQNGGNMEVIMSGTPKSTTKRNSTMSLVKRVDQLEENEEFNAETFEAINKRLNALEKKPKR